MFGFSNSNERFADSNERYVKVIVFELFLNITFMECSRSQYLKEDRNDDGIFR